jgi:hypothetical protein
MVSEMGFMVPTLWAWSEGRAWRNSCSPQGSQEAERWRKREDLWTRYTLGRHIPVTYFLHQGPDLSFQNPSGINPLVKLEPSRSIHFSIAPLAGDQALNTQAFWGHFMSTQGCLYFFLNSVFLLPGLGISLILQFCISQVSFLSLFDVVRVSVLSCLSLIAVHYIWV